MSDLRIRSNCPKCGFVSLKCWSELTPDEELLAERLPASAPFTRAERKKHRICTRCWYEETNEQQVQTRV